MAPKTILALALLIPVVYVWKLNVAPSKIDAETRAALTAARSDISDEERVRIRAQLAVLVQDEE